MRIEGDRELWTGNGLEEAFVLCLKKLSRYLAGVTDEILENLNECSW
jgi:hypothetical protein